MAVGDSPHDAELLSAWENFCDRIKGAGPLVLRDVIPSTPVERASAFRYLTHMLRVAFEFGLESRDTNHPDLFPTFTPTRKMAGDNADGYYLQTWVDPKESYRLFGNIGTVHFINFTVQGEATGTIPEPWGAMPEVSLLRHQIQTQPDGSFEIWLCADRREGNWLPLTPKSRKIHIRQFFRDWESEQPMEVRIERIGPRTVPPPFTPEQLVDALKWSGDFVVNHALAWPENMWKVAGLAADTVNSFAQQTRGQGGWGEAEDARRGRALTLCHWKLQPDEALLVTFVPSENFWMLECENIWSQTFDYRYRMVGTNQHYAQIDPDGRVRALVANRDPGYGNWLDTSDHAEGNLYYRNIITDGLPEFSTRVIKFDEISEIMPPAARRVTAEERDREIETRRLGIFRRFRA